MNRVYYCTLPPFFIFNILVTTTLFVLCFFVTRLSLLFGQFNYGTEGILDLTHKRLFTISSVVRLLEQEGYRLHKVMGVPPPIPKALGDNMVGRVLMGVAGFLAWLWPGMFAYQIYAEAGFLPPLGKLVALTIGSSSAKSGE